MFIVELIFVNWKFVFVIFCCDVFFIEVSVEFVNLEGIVWDLLNNFGFGIIIVFIGIFKVKIYYKKLELMEIVNVK